MPISSAEGSAATFASFLAGSPHSVQSYEQAYIVGEVLHGKYICISWVLEVPRQSRGTRGTKIHLYIYTFTFLVSEQNEFLLF